VLFEKRAEMMKAIPTSKIENDVFFIRGGQSNYVLESDFADIKGLIGKASFDTIPNAGHWLHVEAPEVFMQKCFDYFGVS